MTLNLNMFHTISSVWRDAKSGIGNNVKVLIKQAEDTRYTFCLSPNVTYTSSSTEISTHDASVISHVTRKIKTFARSFRPAFLVWYLGGIYGQIS